MPRKNFVIEARHPDGSLDVKRVGTEPLNGQGTEEQIFRFFFAKHANKDTASWAEVISFFNANGWYIRKKTW